MKKMLLVMLVVILAVVLALVCGKKNEKTLSAIGEDATIEEFYAAFFGSLENNNTNEAIAMVTAALENSDFDNEHPELFRNLMTLTLRVGDVEKAKALLLGAIDNQPTFVSKGLGQVCRYYSNNADINSLLDWTALLLDKKVPAEVNSTICFWRMEALYRADQWNDTIAFIPVLLDRANLENSINILRRISNALMKDGQYDKQSQLLEVVAGLAQGDKVIDSFVTASRINAFLAQGDNKKAKALFIKKGSQMLDKDLTGSFRGLQKSGSEKDNEKLCTFVLEKLQNKIITRRWAAVMWVGSASDKENYKVVITRLNKLLELGIPVNDVLRIYSMQFYTVVKGEDKENIQGMMATGDALAKLLDKKGQKAVHALQLDGSFLLEDYATALKYVEAGIDDRDEMWHKMAVSKIKAHLALKDGRTADAIVNFRDFMELVSVNENGEVDPSTGVIYSKDMLLGQNALRIAKLYQSIGKSAESSSAYEEAADYYTQAMANVDSDSKEYAMIKAEIKKLPAGKGTSK